MRSLAGRDSSGAPDLDDLRQAGRYLAKIKEHVHRRGIVLSLLLNNPDLATRG